MQLHLFREFLRRLSPRRFELYHAEVIRRNLVAMRSYLTVGVGVTLANFIAQLVLFRTVTFGQVVGLLVYYSLFALLNGWLTRTGRTAGTLLMYAMQVPVMLLGILMGTVFDTKNPIITFLMFLPTLPLFILDKPWRVVLYETLSTVLCCALIVAVKDPAVVGADLVHVFSFYVAAVAVSLFVLADRFESVETHVRLQERSEHDALTGLKNRFALRADFEGYLHEDLCVMMADIDFFKTFNDSYGHQVGDVVIGAFADAFVDEFGPAACYRYGGDELLVISFESDHERFHERLARVQDAIARVPTGVRGVRLSCSCGYAWGVAATDAELRRMIARADDCLYLVKEEGRGTIRGARYVPEDSEDIADRVSDMTLPDLFAAEGEASADAVPGAAQDVA